MYTLQEIKDIAKRMGALRDEYGDYFKMKDILDIDKADTQIWSKGNIEPFCCDYITDLFDNTVDPRKLLKTVPQKKDYVTQHYLCGDTPVYSRYYADKELHMEKVYVTLPGMRIEVLFSSRKQTVQDISLTLFDDKGRPIEYYNGVKILHAVRYAYEGDLIVKAESFYEYFTVLDVVMYDDEVFDPARMVQLKKMNPEDVSDYALGYEDRVLKTFTRTDYRPKKIYKNTWKINRVKRSVIKNFTECGIHWLGE